MISDTWKVFGYKQGKGKKPRNMGKLYYGETVDEAEALRRATSIFCFSKVTEVMATSYTRWDEIREIVKDTMWLWGGLPS